MAAINYKHLHYFWQVARTGGVNRAGELLHLTPQTISGQLALLEENLGVALFARNGRNLELTEAGKLAFGYAQEIFALGGEMESALRQVAQGGGRPPLRVGVADAVPKSIAYHLLHPACAQAEPVRLVCREWKLDALLAELALHRLDLVLSDAPLPPGLSIKAYSHRLGGCSVSFFAAPALVAAGATFPDCLAQVPILLPGPDAALRPQLESWLERRGLRPPIAGEFDDGALMKAFGQHGMGVFTTPTVLAEETCRQYAVRCIGEARDLSVAYYALSVERRVTHPSVVAITRQARDTLFAGE